MLHIFFAIFTDLGAQRKLRSVFINEKVLTTPLLITIQLRLVFVDAWSEVVGVTSEGDLNIRQEVIHTVNQVRRWVRPSRHTRFALEYTEKRVKKYLEYNLEW